MRVDSRPCTRRRPQNQSTLRGSLFKYTGSSTTESSQGDVRGAYLEVDHCVHSAALVWVELMAGDLWELLPDGFTLRRPGCWGLGGGGDCPVAALRPALVWVQSGAERVLLVLRSLTSGSSLSAVLFPSRFHTLGST